MLKEHYTVAVIIINYNSSEFTIKCVESVLENTAGDFTYQILIVDNAYNGEDYNLYPKSLKEKESSVLPRVDYVVNLHQEKEAYAGYSLIKLDTTGKVSIIRE